MTSNGRIAALAIAGLAAIGGAVLQVASPDGGSFALWVFAALVTLGTVFDAGYLTHRRSARASWQLTAEREIDHQSGQILAVWFDPGSGERCYLPEGQRPE